MDSTSVKPTSSRDERILDYIFNPEANPLLATVANDDVSMSTHDATSDMDETTGRELASKESAAIELAEQGQLDEALNMLTELIHGWPRYASAYNNRAQMYRLKRNSNAALEDLDLAITHCGHDKRILGQAYAQKAILLMDQGDEDAARDCFEKAGQFGNTIARKQAVSMNPYARMCNRMLSELFAPYRASPSPSAAVKESPP